MIEQRNEKLEFWSQVLVFHLSFLVAIFYYVFTTRLPAFPRKQPFYSLRNNIPNECLLHLIEITHFIVERFNFLAISSKFAFHPSRLASRLTTSSSSAFERLNENNTEKKRISTSHEHLITIMQSILHQSSDNFRRSSIESRENKKFDIEASIVQTSTQRSEIHLY